MASRCPCRPSRPVAAMSFSTSDGVRCSRVRRSLFLTRVGVATFPFTVVGVRVRTARKCAARGMGPPWTLPTAHILGRLGADCVPSFSGTRRASRRGERGLTFPQEGPMSYSRSSGERSSQRRPICWASTRIRRLVAITCQSTDRVPSPLASRFGPSRVLRSGQV